MLHKAYNYCAGPSVLPDEVTHQLFQAMDNFENTGVSLLALSHRDDRFQEIAYQAKELLRAILAIPDHYHILFFHGGATTQFYSLAQNLQRQNKAAYLDCGYWSKLAIKEAQKVTKVDVIEKPYNDLFLEQCYTVAKDYDYLHYIDNETIDGREFQYIPEVATPLVCDMSSNLLSRWFDINRYGMVYAGAQKNLGIPGLAIVIIRDDFVQKHKHIAIVQSYDQAIAKKSLANTPVVMAWYATYLVLKWIKAQGGVKALETLNQIKSSILYDYLDQSALFKPMVAQTIRSRMNAVFNRKDKDAKKVDQFIEQAEKDGFYGINGHRSVGGFRVSLYNAIEVQAVNALVGYLKEFERNDR
ncbi:3-phosphoserine/phosphohydroxythreonine transaminase [Thiotrichales bacterium 19S3-7]|nr:3-phosphoserine/phosphohydroxythreonine transaminase [Thiotrichales bacterium 19S3-7]MCF6803054.1 3-phosphoserine/phosphohydroxythreonine transaminase [Thiotrichales bacterium 19S3-11]